MRPQFPAEMADLAERANEALEALLPKPAGGLEDRLFEAMRYAVMNGGKRLRAVLAMETARLYGVECAQSARMGAAIECLHAYSLVHDDLPAMDNDELRRGKPTTHIAFNEATAILAGDALQTLAFELLAEEAMHANPVVRCELVQALARAAGARGMAAGQMIDMAAENAAPLDLGAIAHLQRLKTGALIEFACLSGAILGQADMAQRRALRHYACDLGAAFQIRDDLLDIEGNEVLTGKAGGKDRASGKATFVDHLGVEGARAQAEFLASQAVRHLDIFGPKAAMLRDIAAYAVKREK